MDNSKNSIIRIIDGAIFVCLVLFLVSLTNSIFVNQLGYFGALLLLITKSILTKKNVFHKTGIESAILLMIAAEILSTVFSVNVSQSIKFVTKFLLLIPVLYTVASAMNDLKTAKLFFKIFIGAALVSCLIYLFLAYDYVIYNQFQIKQSGPSPFQYPITASELISFVVIFLFAFAINEKQKLSGKIFVWVMSFIAGAALLSIYKRTGWMGTFAGIVFIMLYLKKWKFVIPLALLVAVVIIFEKNESDIYVYLDHNSGLKEIQHIKTEGRVREINFDSSFAMIGDYENGILYTQDFQAFSKTKTPSAVLSLFKWKDYYCAALADSRFILYKKVDADEFKYVREFISPGYVNSSTVANGCLYVNDADSGLTIFKNPEDVCDTSRYPVFRDVIKIFIDTTKITFASTGKLEVYALKNFAPSEKVAEFIPKTDFNLLGIYEQYFIISEDSGFRIYELVGDKFRLTITNDEIKSPSSITRNADTVFIATHAKEIFTTIFNKGELKIFAKETLVYSPSNIYYTDGKLIVTHLIQGRLSSFVDANNPSNFTRFALWRAGWQMFLDHPVFGVGNIDLADLYRQYKRPVDKEIQGHMHNNFVHFLVTLGIIGLLTALYLFYRIFRKLHRMYKSSKHIPFVSSYLLGTLGGMVSFLVAGLTEWNFGDHEIITMVWFTIGLACLLFRLSQTKLTK